MLDYASVRGNRRELLALTGLTAREFRLLLLGSFARAYECRHPAGETEAQGRPAAAPGAGAASRRRWAGRRTSCCSSSPTSRRTRCRW